MREKRRPSPIVPALSPPDNIKFSKLAVQSPFTPVPTTAIYHSPPPQTAIFRGYSLNAAPRKPTTWQGSFSFFEHFPAEIRDKIYGKLIGNVIVSVNAKHNPTVVIYGKPTRRGSSYSAYVSPPLQKVDGSHRNWLCVSRQFFYEARQVLWRKMRVEFDRRWDVINAALRGSLDADADAVRGPSGTDALTLFPLRTSILTHIRELQLNLCGNTDFEGRVVTAEAKRVTTAVLHTIQRDMPALKRLRFFIDQRSRICTSITCFIPDAWFLEALLNISQARVVSFASGPGFQGHSQNKKNARACICAMNAVLGAHFSNHPGALKINHDGATGIQLQLRLGRKMLQYIGQSPSWRQAQQMLAMKVVMLESVALAGE